ncbi:DNA repair protein RecO [Microbulbifer pacificus]|uniref:DNA repair protein RecO n=1 Tax=Microbulbifer pacificus TaxID=407164 RepID=A0AAU0N2A5_9GAMM|nr:DNA repair protein RecO [Microbulbifer pacificus]WOX06051.1 DNA repair protein RecO [Microbulbifer pacificus]
MQQLPPQPAYILHSRPFRDTSLILELLTPDYGRIACIAKGARRDKQRRQRALQPFAPLLVTLMGRHDLKTLGPVESAGQSLWLKGRAVYAGLYANELLVRLLPEGDAQLSVFAAYQQLLAQLAALTGEEQGIGGAVLELPLRRFELQLLQALGSCPELDFSPLGNEPIRADGFYRLTAEEGFMPVHLPAGAAMRAGDFSGAHLLAVKSLTLAIEETFVESGSGESCGAEVLAAAKRLCRQILSPLLGNRPLKSRELFRQVYGTQ